jgi:hypothetical protein
MPFRIHASPRPSWQRAFFTAWLCALVAVAGLESATHGHVPAVAGWHDAVPHGATSHDDGLKSCSICRLAHESFVATATQFDVSRPACVIDRPVPRCEPRSLAVLALERSPRAPPVTAAC